MTNPSFSSEDDDVAQCIIANQGLNKSSSLRTCYRPWRNESISHITILSRASAGVIWIPGTFTPTDQPKPLTDPCFSGLCVHTAPSTAPLYYWLLVWVCRSDATPGRSGWYIACQCDFSQSKECLDPLRSIWLSLDLGHHILVCTLQC
jgi:hypothetical protein